MAIDLTDEQWLDMQINFLEAHHYWTKVAIETLTPGKDKVLQRLKSEKQAL